MGDQVQGEPQDLHGKEIMIPSETLDMARRLVSYEAVTGETSEPPEPAVFRVYEKLRQPLCALAGVAGFRSLVVRALTLAEVEAPGLSALQVTDDGYLQRLHSLGEVDPRIDKNLAGEERVILIAELLELLLTFIGETLTMRLVQDVWPDAAFDDGNFGDERKV
jgi:hypothetical protein